MINIKKPNPWNRVMFTWCAVLFLWMVRVIWMGVPIRADVMDPELGSAVRMVIAALFLDGAAVFLCRWIQAEITYYRNKEGRY